ncbi:2-hydroxychromene-2-carboxylate isomerase [Hydrogenophaga sp.]|uniref:2-hydroxychromene-2-carboxylate isomerase n=1 Tax=Hydrogenophaga sp. TaxID=1904254 RepID=UPI0025C275B1|nr:2-hydroxychromene-2-carboxylate isomerase [Hydrogenophaga sp.]
MRHAVDYYFTPNSPWTYIGHARFARMTEGAGASVRVLPMDLAKIFPISGGLPLPKRAPQRQAYRLLELQRFGEALGLPLVVQPRFFPVVADLAARLIVATDMDHGTAAAMRLTGAVGAAVWTQERDIANADTLSAVLAECGLDAALLARAQTPEVLAQYEQNTQAAIDAGVFGAPSYVVDGELFWGQDRLDFVERRLLS